MSPIATLLGTRERITLGFTSGPLSLDASGRWTVPNNPTAPPAVRWTLHDAIEAASPDVDTTMLTLEYLERAAGRINLFAWLETRQGPEVVALCNTALAIARKDGHR